MSFSSSVKEEAFVKCGRCCCICGKFCGTKIEVHHIKPKAQGGDNTIENCVPLCFDCHAEMSTYDSKHPKGNKYSQSELKRHRDETFKKHSSVVTKTKTAIADRRNLINVHQKQSESINNSSLLPWTSEIRSVSFDFLLPDLYIQPLIRTYKHPAPTNLELKFFIENQGNGKNIILTGVPGSGKTTTLRALFCNSDQESKLTLYFTAKEVINHASKKAPTLISLLRAMYSLSLSVEDISIHHNILVFIDGVDEIDYTNFEMLFQFCKKLQNDNIMFWISVRSDINKRYIINSPAYNSLFYEICELVNWTKEQGLYFARCYSEKSGKNFIIDRINSLLTSNSKASSFLENPFKLSLLIFILSDDDCDVSQIDANDYTLYKKFYEHWRNQEKKRGTSPNDHNYIHNIHIKIAIALYRERSSISLKTIFNDQCNIEKIMTDSAIIGLLNYKKTTLEETIIVEKFLHETLSEFFVAECIIECFRDNIETNELNERMSITYEFINLYEVNKFVRSAFEAMHLTERSLMLNNMSNKYNELIVQKTNIAEMIREQIIYHVGRIPHNSPPEILKNAYNNEQNSVIKRAAALGLILSGDETIEADFIGKLLSDKTLDLENRSIQLVYFGDAKGMFHAYKDDEIIEWKNTKRAILERFSNNSMRDIRLRLWDIVTFKSFIISRGLTGLSNDEINIIKETVIDNSTISKARKELLTREKDSLLTYLSERMLCDNK